MDKQRYFNIMTNYKRMCSDMVSNISTYESWSDEFCRKQIKDLYGKIIKEFDNIDFTQFSSDELKTFDFKWFDENLLCMPIWAIQCLPNGAVITCIDGEEKVYQKGVTKLDDDTRFGVTAYGFTKAQLRDSSLEELTK